MKNNKGFLLVSETLKIIIAVICIGFLIYFLVHLYFANQEPKNLEFAKDSLNHLVEGINAKSSEIEIYNPQRWIIVSWPHDITTGGFLGLGTKREEGMPKSCSNLGWNNCICICPKDKPDNCDENGVCFESEFTTEDIIKIKNVPLILIVDYDNKKIK